MTRFGSRLSNSCYFTPKRHRNDLRRSEIQKISWGACPQTLLAGTLCMLGLQMLSRAMGHHGRGNHPCHLCNNEDGPLQISLLDHILKTHWKELHLGSEMDMEWLMDMLSRSQLEVLSNFKIFLSPIHNNIIFTLLYLSYLYTVVHVFNYMCFMFCTTTRAHLRFSMKL